MQTKPTSIRLSDEAKELQKLLAKSLGVSQHAVIELALREMATRKKIKVEAK